MKASSIIFALCTLFAASAARQASADELTTSLAFVKNMGINANFGQMVRFGAVRMQTYQNVVCVLGRAEAQQLVELELGASIAKYQPQWDRNLAAVWSQQLTETEMQSLIDLKRQSPHVAKYQDAGPKAGAAMMSSSSEILQSALSEGMNNAWSKTPAVLSANPRAGCKQ